MGWRDALERQLWAECAGKRVEVYSALTAMPAPDRIAMARELLAGTGRVVAIVPKEAPRRVDHIDDPEGAALLRAQFGGWNLCRKAMLIEDTP